MTMSARKHPIVTFLPVDDTTTTTTTSTTTAAGRDYNNNSSNNNRDYSLRRSPASSFLTWDPTPYNTSATSSMSLGVMAGAAAAMVRAQGGGSCYKTSSGVFEVKEEDDDNGNDDDEDKQEENDLGLDATASTPDRGKEKPPSLPPLLSSSSLEQQRLHHERRREDEALYCDMMNNRRNTTTTPIGAVVSRELASSSSWWLPSFSSSKQPSAPAPAPPDNLFGLAPTGVGTAKVTAPSCCSFSPDTGVFCDHHGHVFSEPKPETALEEATVVVVNELPVSITENASLEGKICRGWTPAVIVILILSMGVLILRSTLLLRENSNASLPSPTSAPSVIMVTPKTLSPVEQDVLPAPSIFPSTVFPTTSAASTTRPSSYTPSSDPSVKPVSSVFPSTIILSRMPSSAPSLGHSLPTTSGPLTALSDVPSLVPSPGQGPSSIRPTTRRPATSSPSSSEPSTTPSLPTPAPPSPSLWPHKSQSPQHTSLSSSPIYDGLFDFLVSISPDGGEALQNSTSPQHQAYVWLSGNKDLTIYSPRRIRQRYSLATFYYSSNGDEWIDRTNWLTDEDECKWFSRAMPQDICGPRDSEFQRLEVYYNNLSGVLPSELSLLSDTLQSISLLGGPSRHLSGTIPTHIGKLAKLENLRLANNHLTGTLMTEIGELAKLRYLDLRKNNLTGELVREIGRLPLLSWMDLSYNDFTGRLPTELGEDTDLTFLELSFNGFRGPIPASLGILTKLKTLSINNNRLEEVNANIGKMAALQSLSLANNALAGTIPDSIGKLDSLSSLNMSFNQLSGTLPSTIVGRLCNVRDVLDLSSNHLSGTLPSTIVTRDCALRSFLLNDNMFTGRIPTSFAWMTRITLLRLDSNHFTGTVPSSVCKAFNRTFPSFFANCDELVCPCCSYCCSDHSCKCRYEGTTNDWKCFP